MSTHTRRSLLVLGGTALGGAALAGCAGPSGADGRETAGNATDAGAADNPALGDVTPTGGLSLSSPAFEDGGSIPETYGRAEANVNPPLRIDGVPSGAASLALVMDDPDAVEAAGKVWLHWLVWNIDPSRREIPEGWTPDGAVVGVNDFGERGYGGPQPPSGVHTYRFKCYALATTLEKGPSASKRAVGRAMAGHVLAATQLEGTYAAD